MTKKFYLPLTLLMIISMLLSACGATPTAEAVVVQPTAVPATAVPPTAVPPKIGRAHV